MASRRPRDARSKGDAMNARRITTTAEPFAPTRIPPGTPARTAWTVYREPKQYCGDPSFVYRTPDRDCAAGLAAELNSTAQGTEHYFFHRSEN